MQRYTIGETCCFLAGLPNFWPVFGETVHSAAGLPNFGPVFGGDGPFNGRLRLKGEEMVCAETIYRWIWQEKRRGNDELARSLRHGWRRKRRRDSLYRPRGIIQDRVDISLRPTIVDEKKRFGDFEMDIKMARTAGGIMTTNDRCTHLVLIRRLAGKEATQLASTEIEALLPYKDKTHTITADNRKEFARHKEIAKRLDAEFYYRNPIPLLGAGCKRKHERADTPVHSERNGLQQADRRDAC